MESVEHCLVIAFGAYTIRLLSPRVKKLLTLVPVELKGWETPAERLRLDDITMYSLLDEIESVRQANGFSRVAVLGFSFGGMIALDYALAFPDHVSKIIAICSPPCWTSSFKWSRCSTRSRICESSLRNCESIPGRSGA